MVKLVVGVTYVVAINGAASGTLGDQTDYRALTKHAPFSDTTLMKNNSATARPTIVVIDDDAAMRVSIEFLLRSVRYNTIGLDSAAAFGLGKLAGRPILQPTATRR